RGTRFFTVPQFFLTCGVQGGPAPNDFTVVRAGIPITINSKPNAYTQPAALETHSLSTCPYCGCFVSKKRMKKHKKKHETVRCPSKHKRSILRVQEDPEIHQARINYMRYMEAQRDSMSD